jgi:ceramide glucosyltransferase
MTDMLADLCWALILSTLAMQILSCAVVLVRLRRPAERIGASERHRITIIRPVCGLEHDLERTLSSTFNPYTRDCEILFCVASFRDPAIPLINHLIAAHPQHTARLLIGEDRISGNPKLNNLAKGWDAASHVWIAMIDSNLLLPRDFVQRLMAQWTPGTGLVTSPPAGVALRGFWSQVECAFLNTYQVRWQLASDEIGNGFAQGKVLFWRRDVLDAAGGLAALGHDMAEDVSATKIVRRAGLTVQVVARPFPQPLGRRSFAEVWRRQLRWARVRRLGFPVLFMAEILSGGLAPLVALSTLAAFGLAPWILIPTIIGLWYGAEWALARQAGWPASWRDIVAWILRDVMIPAVWLASWGGNGFEWRGKRMETAAPHLAAAE